MVTDKNKDPQRTKLNIIARPLNPYKKIINLKWLSGFVSAEGNFFVNIIYSKTKVGK